MKNIHSSIFIIIDILYICLLITGIFFNSLHSVARQFSQKMDANEDFSLRVMDANEDLSPRVGMEFDTLEDAWEFWLKYGRKMGFDVRKHCINKSKKDGTITSRGFVCAKQGIRGPEKENMIHTSN